MNVVDFKTLQKKKYILLDGAMGTMLQKRGLKIGGDFQANLNKLRKIVKNTSMLVLSSDGTLLDPPVPTGLF